MARNWIRRTQQGIHLIRAGRWASSIVLLCSLVFFVSSEAQGATGLTLLDATFAERISDRQPQTRLTSFSLGGRSGPARLWFWFQLSCVDECLEQVITNGKITVTLHWYFDTGGGLSSKLITPLEVKAGTWRTQGFKQDLKPGTWKVVVHFENARVCLKDDQCEFSVEVTP